MPNHDIRERVVRTVSTALNLNEKEEENLRREVGYKLLKKWSSARHAAVIVALEDEFGIEIEEMTIPMLNNVTKIVNYISKVLSANS